MRVCAVGTTPVAGGTAAACETDRRQPCFAAPGSEAPRSKRNIRTCPAWGLFPAPRHSLHATTTRPAITYLNTERVSRASVNDDAYLHRSTAFPLHPRTKTLHSRRRCARVAAESNARDRLKRYSSRERKSRPATTTEATTVGVLTAGGGGRGGGCQAGDVTTRLVRWRRDRSGDRTPAAWSRSVNHS